MLGPSITPSSRSALDLTRILRDRDLNALDAVLELLVDAGLRVGTAVYLPAMTAVGVLTNVAVPFPSSPKPLPPQQRTVLSARNAHVCSAPALTAVTSLSSGAVCRTAADAPGEPAPHRAGSPGCRGSEPTPEPRE